MRRAILLALVLVGCQNQPQPQPNNNTNTLTVNLPSTPTGPSVNPTTGGCAVARLAGGIFGDAGGGACAGRLAGQLKVGCTVFGTVTPKTAENTDTPPALHGNAITYSVVRNSGVVTRIEDSDNPFNYTMTASGVGDGTGYALKADLTVPGCTTTFEKTYEFPIQP